MILKTNDFQNACKTIALAADGNAANLGLFVKDGFLFLNVTNKEYYVSVKFSVDETEEFNAVVDAALFLNLISGITTEDFELKTKDNTVVVKSGKSNYKLAMIYENEKLMDLPVISIENKTVEMPISKDILMSILNVNSKELSKTKGSDSTSVNELQKLYYLTNEGCFTFTTGACLNSFTLDKPVQILINDRLVKLFKLFKSDVIFSLGQDPLSNGTIQTKVSFQTDDIYLSAVITNDEVLLSRVQGPCTATKNFINSKYSVNAVLSVNTLNAAISRLLLFTKNSISKANMHSVMANIEITNNDFIITDKLGNSESVTIENGSYIDSDYTLPLNIADLKLVLDSCKDEHITFNCGNQRSVVVTRGNISNLIPEGRRD